MLKHPLLLTGLLACIGTQAAVHTTESDTSRVVNLEEAIVVATPKQTTQLRKQPLSANIYSGKELEQLQVTSLKGLSALTPNFFMPDYGSRYTSAVYIRGIGSRMNTPAVGLYVDNIAYVDKSAYDFSFTDIERVDVLRGPQATLYGRNTMGGVIRVYTSDPLLRLPPSCIRRTTSASRSQDITMAKRDSSRMQQQVSTPTSAMPEVANSA